MSAQKVVRTGETDAFAQFKAMQREIWKHYAPLESHTTRTAAHLVRVAGVEPGQRVLDVGCGTGPVALTARRCGAEVTGIDLTPELLERAGQHARVADVEDIEWREADVEALPFADGEFDVVLSQFAHIFAPRPQVAAAEMLRVLSDGGTIAFSTWIPEGASGALFGALASYMDGPGDVPMPTLWGEVPIIRERLGNRVHDLYFEHGTLEDVAMSPQHTRLGLESTLGPFMAVLERHKNDPQTLARIRRDVDHALTPYHYDNITHFEYLVTRGVKA